MNGAQWIVAGSAVIALAAVAVVLWDSRSMRQKVRNAEGAAIGLRLDLDAAQARIAELETYLADRTSWQAEPTTAVPSTVADRAPRDRWTPATHPPDDTPAQESLPT